MFFGMGNLMMLPSKVILCLISFSESLIKSKNGTMYVCTNCGVVLFFPSERWDFIVAQHLTFWCVCSVLK